MRPSMRGLGLRVENHLPRGTWPAQNVKSGGVFRRWAGAKQGAHWRFAIPLGWASGARVALCSAPSLSIGPTPWRSTGDSRHGLHRVYGGCPSWDCPGWQAYPQDGRYDRGSQARPEGLVALEQADGHGCVARTPPQDALPSKRHVSGLLANALGKPLKQAWPWPSPSSA